MERAHPGELQVFVPLLFRRQERYHGTYYNFQHSHGCGQVADSLKCKLLAGTLTTRFSLELFYLFIMCVYTFFVCD